LKVFIALRTVRATTQTVIDMLQSCIEFYR